MPNRIYAGSITFKGWPAVQLENDFASIVIIPQIGGKIVSIQSRSGGREFLWQDDTRPYRQPRYGDGFGNYDASGFDECFPTIGECIYPEFPWQGIIVPDHGELWCIPWQHELGTDSVYLHTYGVRFPYRFEKRLTLAPDAGRCTIAYRVTNLSPFDLKYLWSAHPLFAAQEGMRILLPGEPEVRLTFALGNRVNGDFLQNFRWPWLCAPDGETVDYSLIGSPDLKANDKVYANAPAEGWCALHEPQSGDFIALGFPPDKIPLVGVCIDHGGWPFEGQAGYWVALEPCTGLPDPLDQAIAQREYATLPANGCAEWSLALHIGQADSADQISQLMSAESRALGENR